MTFGLFSTKYQKVVSSLLVAAIVLPIVSMPIFYPLNVKAQAIDPDVFGDLGSAPILPPPTTGGGSWSDITSFLGNKGGSILGGNCQSGGGGDSSQFLSQGVGLAATAGALALSAGPFAPLIGGAASMITSMFGGGKKRGGGGSSVCEAIIDALFEKLINKLVNDTVNWIQNGGRPRFASNWKTIFEDAADEAAGAFLNELTGLDLCEPIRIALPRFYPTYLPVADKFGCTLSDAIENLRSGPVVIEQGHPIEDVILYMESMVREENNLYGFNLSAQLEYDKRTNLNKEARRSEAIAGRGFLSDRRCEAWYGSDGELVTGSATEKDLAENDLTCLPNSWRVLTPGEIITASAIRAATKDYDILQSKLIRGAISSIFSALINALINRVANEGLAFMKTGKGSNVNLTPTYGTYQRLPEPNEQSKEQIRFLQSMTELKDVVEQLMQRNAELYQPYLDELTQIADKAVAADNLGKLAELVPVVEDFLTRLNTEIGGDVGLEDKEYRQAIKDKLDAINDSVNALDLSVTVNVYPDSTGP